MRKAEKEWNMDEKGTRKRGGRVGEGVENVDEKGREKGVREVQNDWKKGEKGKETGMIEMRIKKGGKGVGERYEGLGFG